MLHNLPNSSRLGRLKSRLVRTTRTMCACRASLEMSIVDFASTGLRRSLGMDGQ